MRSTSQEYVDATAPSVERERSTAALGYFLWPLALPVLMDAGTTSRSPWAKHQARRALTFGVLSSLVIVALFALPLLVVILAGLGTEQTLTVYGIGFILDIVGVALVIAIALREARRAARGG